MRPVLPVQDRSGRVTVWTAWMLDVMPRAAIRIGGDRVHARHRRRLSGWKIGPAVFKVDWALDGPIPWADEWTPGQGRCMSVDAGNRSRRRKIRSTPFASGATLRAGCPTVPVRRVAGPGRQTDRLGLLSCPDWLRRRYDNCDRVPDRAIRS